MFEGIQLYTNRLALVLVPMFLCVSLIFILNKFATNIGIVDKPNERKQHTGYIPLIGGIAMFAALAISLPIFMPNYQYIPMLAISFVLLLTGIMDDYLDLSPSLRLIIQIVTAVLMVILGETQISSIGNLTGDGPILLSQNISIVITVVCAVGVINAINMLDGMDGLAGSILLLSFLGLGTLAYLAGHPVVTQQLLLISGALIGFLFFNMRIFVLRAKVFMGDSGSMFLGFVLCWYCLRLSQGAETSLSPVSAGWIFGLPLIDIIAVVLRRIASGRSPFSASRDHLHHLLMDAGWSVNSALYCLLLIHGTMVAVGILITLYPQFETFAFWIFGTLGLIRLFIISPWLSNRALIQTSERNHHHADIKELS